MNLIFLDIDGVMNCQSLSVKYFNRHIRRYGDRLEAPKHITRGVEAPTKRAIKHLNYIIKKTKAEIVISSAWRNDFSDLGWNHYFYALGIKGYVQGLTDWLPGERGEEIQKYLDEHEHIKNFVVIDDDYDYFNEHIKSHWVVCNYKIGLTKKEADIAIKVLKGELL